MCYVECVRKGQHQPVVDGARCAAENHRFALRLIQTMKLIRRLAFPLLLTVATLLATIATWRALTDNETRQIARIIEAESYAARSRLVREMDTLLRGVRDLQAYWATNGHLPREIWAPQEAVNLAYTPAIDFVLWHAPGQDRRFLYSAEHQGYDYRPAIDEWQPFAGLLKQQEGTERETISVPTIDSAGEATFEIVLPAQDAADGMLLAVVDADELLREVLDNDSPGYAIDVSWNDVQLYQRGRESNALPSAWIEEGLIRILPGTIWKVRHAPTDELRQSLSTPANSAVLYAGIAISVLLGLLLFETDRANRRTLAALRAEKELSELNQDLETQIAARTRSLEERSADLVTIADSVAHDLRNPLNSISTNAQLLEQQFAGSLGDDGMSILRQVSHCVEGMAEIIDRLLRLSVVSNVTFRRERIDMHALVSETYDELIATEPPPPVEFVLHELPDADADPDLVPILLLNLIGNALKYTRGRSARRIECGSASDDGINVFYIRDNGIGFEPAMAARMFSAFERLGENEQPGLGLGLDIAARIASRHEGRIWAEGRPGQGATFYFTLGSNRA